MQNSLSFAFIIQFFFIVIAILVPLIYPHQFFHKQYGAYNLLIIFACSTLCAWLVWLVAGIDPAITFTRIMLITGVGTSIALFAQMRTMLLLILDRSEFVHDTVDNIIRVDEIVKHVTKGEKGDTGEEGERGRRGQQGEAGEAGIKGDKGEKG